MSELSVFIDESGDFGEYSIQPAYYLVTFVFHDQRQDITTNIQHLEESVSNSGFQLDYIHTGPVIRREEIFDSYTIDERRKLIYKMLNFVVASPISHLTVCIDRRQAQDKVTLSGRLARAINIAMLEHIDYFNSFDRILVYYDIFPAGRALSVIAAAGSSSRRSQSSQATPGSRIPRQR